MAAPTKYYWYEAFLVTIIVTGYQDTFKVLNMKSTVCRLMGVVLK